MASLAVTLGELVAHPAAWVVFAGGLIAVVMAATRGAKAQAGGR